MIFVKVILFLLAYTIIRKSEGSGLPPMFSTKSPHGPVYLCPQSNSDDFSCSATPRECFSSQTSHNVSVVFRITEQEDFSIDVVECMGMSTTVTNVYYFWGKQMHYRNSVSKDVTVQQCHSMIATKITPTNEKLQVAGPNNLNFWKTDIVKDPGWEWAQTQTQLSYWSIVAVGNPDY